MTIHSNKMNSFWKIKYKVILIKYVIIFQYHRGKSLGNETKVQLAGQSVNILGKINSFQIYQNKTVKKYIIKLLVTINDTFHMYKVK